jgi:hypothetical protein
MLRFWNGVPTTDDIALINKTCVMTSSRKPPPSVPVAVYKNCNHDAINCAQFESFCEQNKPVNPTELFKGAILVFMDNLEMRDGVKTYVHVMSSRVL